ncbi:MAG: hypothetical protein ACREJ2_15170, partial [Planctomycetota bacterium]
LWARRWPRAGVVLLAAWAALPPLAWFLSVDVMSRDATAFPGWLTLNPIYAPVLLDRRPQDLPAYAPWVTLAVLFAVPAAAGLWQRLRRRG